MCKPPCCESSSGGGGGLGVIVGGAGLLIAAAVVYQIVATVAHAVMIAVPYILAGVGMVAVTGAVGTVWLVVRGSPPKPEFISQTNRQRMAFQESQPELTWTAQVLAIGGKPVTAPAYVQETRPPTHAR
jgi:hypothetical protein